MTHFGLQGCKEQRKLRCGDVVINKDIDDKEHLEYFEPKQRQEREKIREISDRLSLYILTVSLDFLNCYDIEVIVEHLLTCISLLSLTLDLMYESLL